ncbi:hypothetical protein BLA29_013742 [Euroglyphus maynei]|uniref:Uncharacterized protein n=1 Tax=Euroglyphus maynei TaxID=6958 RepID=A0A1Y3BNW6_EURMA|nr:hypothetical protein BLA29_013742 [Euroglyphus maynei]
MIANKNDLQKNCKSKIVVKNDENANVKNNNNNDDDKNSKSAKIVNDTDPQQQPIKDENDDTDMYHNYPDLTLTPNSDDQQPQQQQQEQQQVTDPNTSCDDQSQVND